MGRIERDLLACVMNIITHENVYSLYPYSTFVNRRSLIVPRENRLAVTSQEQYDNTLRKWQRRGWKLEAEIRVDEMTGLVNRLPTHIRGPFRHKPTATTRPSDFAAGDRYMGDDRSLVLPLQPPLANLPDNHRDTFRLNSWALQYTTSPLGGYSAMAYHNVAEFGVYELERHITENESQQRLVEQLCASGRLPQLVDGQ